MTGARGTPPDATLVEGYRAGCLAAVVGLHMDYYAPEWGFGLPFETKVAAEMAEFLGRCDPARDLFLLALDPEGRIVGSITVDGPAPGETAAHLRWFIMAPSHRGTGVGGALMARAVAFCDERDYAESYLTTFEGLEAARRLYERHGYALVSTAEIDQWSGGVREQRFERGRPGA